jgi:hypothetical protein
MSVANPKHWPDWLDEHIWPQIQTMICNDASFKLMGEARRLTGEFNGLSQNSSRLVISRLRCSPFAGYVMMGEP